MDKYLWSFYWDCGRSGDLDGLFVATEEEINNAIGNRVWFGEALGKHSEVYGDLEEGDIKKINISPEAVEEVSKHLGTTWSGWNPLNYVEYTCDECGESYSPYDAEIIYREDIDMTTCYECYKKIVDGEED